MKPVMIMYGDPVGGFKIVGPVVPNSYEIERITDEVLFDETWWYVTIIDAGNLIAYVPFAAVGGGPGLDRLC